MLIYLDTSLVLRALEDPPFGGLLRSILSRGSDRWIFSGAHLDDLSGAQPREALALTSVLDEWPFRSWAIAGNSLPHIEVEALMAAVRAGRRPEGPPTVIFDKLEDLTESYPAYFDVIDARGEVAPLLDSLAERNEQKKVAATAYGHARAAHSSSFRPAKDGRQLQRFLRATTPEGHEEAAQEWSALRDYVKGALDETPFRLDDFPRMMEGAGSAFPGLNSTQMRHLGETAAAYLRAVLDDDRAGAADAMERATQLDGPIVENANPLGLSLTSKAYRAFTWFWVWLPPTERELLRNDKVRLAAFFKSWRASQTVCPGSHVYQEVEWQLLRDSRSRSNTSDDTDLYHVALLPYVDVLFVDKRIHTYLQQTALPKPLKKRAVRTSEAENWFRDHLREER